MSHRSGARLFERISSRSFTTRSTTLRRRTFGRRWPPLRTRDTSSSSQSTTGRRTGVSLEPAIWERSILTLTAPVIGFLNPDVQVHGPFLATAAAILRGRVVITGCRFNKSTFELQAWGVRDWVCGAGDVRDP